VYVNSSFLDERDGRDYIFDDENDENEVNVIDLD